MASKAFKEMLASKQFITAPGVFDLVSAKIADRTGAQAIYMTGIWHRGLLPWTARRWARYLH